MNSLTPSIVPAVVRGGLEAPLDLAVFRIDRDARGRPLVVAGTHVRVPRRRVAGAEIGEAGLGIVGAAEPGRAAAELVHVAGPGLVDLAGHRGFLALVGPDHAFEHGARPDEFAGLGAARLDAAGDAEFAAGDAGEDQRAIGLGRNDQRRRGRGIAALEVVDRLLPDGLAGLGVERDELRVERREIDLVLPDRRAAVDDVAAGQDAFGQLGVILPDLFAGLGVDGEEAAVGAGDIDDAVVDEAPALSCPRCFSPPNENDQAGTRFLTVVVIDLLERAEALALRAQAVGENRSRRRSRPSGSFRR